MQICCVPTARCLSIAPLLPAIDMAGYPIKSLGTLFYGLSAYL